MVQALVLDTGSESLESQCVGCGEVYKQTKYKEDKVCCLSALICILALNY